MFVCVYDSLCVSIYSYMALIYMFFTNMTATSSVFYKRPSGFSFVMYNFKLNIRFDITDSFCVCLWLNLQNVVTMPVFGSIVHFSTLSSFGQF